MSLAVEEDDELSGEEAAWPKKQKALSRQTQCNAAVDFCG